MKTSSLPVREAAREFLALKRIAVAGASRGGGSPGNGIADKLRGHGYEVFLVNPNADRIGGHEVFPAMDAIPGGVDGVVCVTAPQASAEVAVQAARAGATWIWFHQGFGPVSFDDAGLQAAREAGLKVLSVGCPMMFLEPDVFHKCARTVFQWAGRIPRAVEVVG